MIDFLKMLFSEIGDLLSFFVTVALIQNIVLTTGFGASLMLHIVRKPKNIWLFTAIMAGFAVLTVIAGYPLDLHFGTGVDHLWRPLMMVGITAVLYILATLFRGSGEQRSLRLRSGRQHRPGYWCQLELWSADLAGGRGYRADG